MVQAYILRSWQYCISAALTMMLYGYDASAFNAAQGYDTFMTYFHKPNANLIASATTAYTVAAIVGGFFIAPAFSDKLGRRMPIFAGSVLVVGATFLQTFAPHQFGAYIGGRALIGLGQGIALPAGATYLSEMAPTAIRGRVLSMFQVFYSVGSFICFWAAYGTTKSSSVMGDWKWKTVTLLQLVCPLLIIASMLFAPETPRWLVAHGYPERARAVLAKTRPAEDVEAELESIDEAIAYERENMKGVSYKFFFTDKSTRWRFFLACVINFGQQATGQGSLNNYSTIIYKKVFHSADTIQLINALNATLGILFTLNASWAVERFGRKPVLVVGAIGQAACMFTVALVGSQTATGADGSKSTGVAVGIVVLLFSFIFFYKPSWGATVWVYTSEIFSMQTRATGVGMASQVQNVANAILQQAFPAFLDAAGFYTFFFFFGFNAFLAAFVWFLVPETKGVSLEEIDVLFGGVDHRKEGQVIQEETGTGVHGQNMKHSSEKEKSEEERREIA